MLKSLGTTLLAVGALVGLMLLILRKGVFGGWMVVLVLCALLIVVTVVSELVKMHGKKVQGRDRHP